MSSSSASMSSTSRAEAAVAPRSRSARPPHRAAGRPPRRLRAVAVAALIALGAGAASPGLAQGDGPAGTSRTAPEAPAGGELQRSASRTDPVERARALMAQAQSHLQAGEVGDAAQRLRQAVGLDPGLHTARYQYARIMVASGRRGYAREILRAGLERAPGHVRMARLYAALAAEAEDWGTAAAALQQARDRAGDAASAQLTAQLAGVYRGAGQYAQAIELYRELSAAQPQAAGRWRMGQALAAERAGDDQAALAAWRAARAAGGLSEALTSYAEARIEALEQEAE